MEIVAREFFSLPPRLPPKTAVIHLYTTYIITLVFAEKNKHKQKTSHRRYLKPQEDDELRRKVTQLQTSSKVSEDEVEGEEKNLQLEVHENARRLTAEEPMSFHLPLFSLDTFRMER